jgi:probable pyridine nucleotide-disulfide oxidoreductase
VVGGPPGRRVETSAKGGTTVRVEIEDVDLLVVGGGKAGKSLAVDRARAGWSVAMVERDKIGGTCINVACIPTKTLVASTRTLISARRPGEFGVEIEGQPRISL